MPDKLVSDRAQNILKALIEYYIREGQPVASKTLSQDNAIQLSSASIRNVLSELENCGLIYAPHTSAGRIPTTQGYRFFIDSLLTVKHFDETKLAQFQEQLKVQQNTQGLIASTSELLSGITHHVGIVTVPKVEQLTLRHVEFLSLSHNRVLIVLVLNDQDVQNRIIKTDKVYSASELEQASNFLNSQYAGKDLNSIRSELLTTMKADKDNINSSMQSAIDMANKAFNESEDEDEMVVSGQSSLLDIAEQSDVSHIRTLLDAFGQKKDVLHLLDQCLNTEGVQIFIGEESGHEIFKDCSVVTSTYKAENEVMGILGVVGPTRMDYQHVISIVDVTARLLSASLGRGGKDE